MYQQTAGVTAVGAPQQGMMHQQPPQMHQGQQQAQSNNQNSGGGMPSPLYPWMRSQFGESLNFISKNSLLQRCLLLIVVCVPT